MRIDHLAIYVSNLELMKSFYEKYFNAEASELYHNHDKHFRSYFLSFSEGCRLELMQQKGIPENLNDAYLQNKGIIHFAISVGSEEAVNELTERLRRKGYEVVGEPRMTGDGYYEAVVLDPEKNRIEITI